MTAILSRPLHVNVCSAHQSILSSSSSNVYFLRASAISSWLMRPSLLLSAWVNMAAASSFPGSERVCCVSVRIQVVMCPNKISRHMTELNKRWRMPAIEWAHSSPDLKKYESVIRCNCQCNISERFVKCAISYGQWFCKVSVEDRFLTVCLYCYGPLHSLRRERDWVYQPIWGQRTLGFI